MSKADDWMDSGSVTFKKYAKIFFNIFFVIVGFIGIPFFILSYKAEKSSNKCFYNAIGFGISFLFWMGVMVIGVWMKSEISSYAVPFMTVNFMLFLVNQTNAEMYRNGEYHEEDDEDLDLDLDDW